jgi:hypothetical protein
MMLLAVCGTKSGMAAYAWTWGLRSPAMATAPKATLVVTRLVFSEEAVPWAPHICGIRFGAALNSPRLESRTQGET